MLTGEVATTAHSSEHATYLVDVRRRRRERLAWRTAAVVLVILLSGPAWQALRDVGAAKPAAVAAQPAAVPLDAGDPAPVAPSGVGDVTRLEPVVRRAVDRAIAAAAADGVELRVTSGWRSAAQQQRLYEQAVRKYGSPAKARRWVLPPAESEHVRGRAVDIGPAAGARWLDRFGVRFGLCRRYANESWHFELLAPKKGQACPALEPHA
jgi:hypothetical protein